MIVTTAILHAKSGKEQELEQLLREMIPRVQMEEGAVQYTLHHAQETPGRFLFYEKYRDQAACDYHMTTPYLRELLKQLEGLLVNAPNIESFEEIAGFIRVKEGSSSF